MLIEADFLMEKELVELIMLIRKHATRSPLLTGPADYRTSSTVSFAQLNHPVVALVEKLIANRIGCANHYAEGLQGAWYRPGEGYRIHHDAFHPETKEWDAFVDVRGNRTHTAMIYLNTLTDGGETCFPELGLTVAPRAGMLVSWRNLNFDRSPNMNMMHAANPAKGADKYVVTQWFREGDGLEG